MKKLLIALTLTSSAALSMAIDRVASYSGDAYIFGVNVMSTSGVVNVEWTGYEAPYYGRTAWHVMVWDTAMGDAPIANEYVLASSVSSDYSRNYSVTPGHAVRVELYAAANQYWNDPNPSHNIATYMWVSPVENYSNGYAATNPAAYQQGQFYNYPLNSFTTYPYPNSYSTGPFYQTPTNNLTFSQFLNGLYVTRP